MNLLISLGSVGLMSLVMSCVSPQKIETTEKSVLPSSEITWLGEKAPLSSKGKLKVGNSFPEVKVIDSTMKEALLSAKGEVTIISVIPSIDTPVCEVQTHTLGETKNLNTKVRKVTISADLPYAQKRFAQEAKLSNITYFSDYKFRSFGDQTGLRILRNDLLARAVIVVDKEGKVRHLQVVPEVTQMPDMEKAFAVANDLAK